MPPQILKEKKSKYKNASIFIQDQQPFKIFKFSLRCLWLDKTLYEKHKHGSTFLGASVNTTTTTTTTTTKLNIMPAWKALIDQI
jgi:hypothetical protein